MRVLIKTKQHEGDKVLSAGHCFGLLKTRLFSFPRPPSPFHPPILLPPLSHHPHCDQHHHLLHRGTVAARMWHVFLRTNFLFYSFSSRQHTVRIPGKETEDPSTPPHSLSLWVFFIPPSLCLLILHFPSVALTGHFLPAPPSPPFLSSLPDQATELFKKIKNHSESVSDIHEVTLLHTVKLITLH